MSHPQKLYIKKVLTYDHPSYGIKILVILYNVYIKKFEILELKFCAFQIYRIWMVILMFSFSFSKMRML